MATNQPQSTRQLLEKIPSFPCLYRHGLNGTYYGIKKVRGKRKEHSLGTTDRKIAERRLKEWLSDLEKIDTDVEKMPLSILLLKFEALNQGKGDKTRATNNSMISVFKSTWKRGLGIQVRDVKPSDLGEWLASQEARLKNSTYNRYACFLKQLFEVAVADRVIARSPYEEIRTRWKKPQKPMRFVPTTEQFENIVRDIRSQIYSADAEDTGNFVEFLGSAGLGQAEARGLTWGAVDWQSARMAIRRKKTAAVFYVPLFAHLRPLLERMLNNLATPPKETDNVFRIKDAKRALQAACKRLGYRAFSQRNLRASLILRLWQAGVDLKLIAKWQGHVDGGKLILDTYTEVFGERDTDYEQEQLAKLTSMSSQRSSQCPDEVSVSSESLSNSSAVHA